MMENKICFITCVNNEKLYNECFTYLSRLNIPEGFTVESIAIRNGKSMASSYNVAMTASDAKYKVYLHQDVFITNKNFIHDVIKVFANNPEIGLMGVIGTKTIPANGIWWESTHKTGKVYESHTGKMELLAYEEFDGEFDAVKALDGLILMTQYDVAWREDLFDGWHFYDVSQCMEFVKAGYKVAVPKQESAWCIHDCGLVSVRNGYEKYRNIFLDEYSKHLYPLVSIMITAYNRPEYFKIALESAINQTYRNIEIVICDNSTNDSVQKVVKPYLQKYANIRYKLNDESMEVIENFKQCLEISKGEYVCYLMDDDIYHVDKVTRMVNYFLEYKDVTLVTSYRQLIDENGKHLRDIESTKKLFDKVTLVDGKAFADHILNTQINYIGETTTPLFRKKDIENNFGYFLGRQYKVIADMVTWLKLLTKGKLVYIPEALSYFRLHGGQDQKRVKTILRGAQELYYMISDSFRNSIITDSMRYKKLLYTWLYRHSNEIDIRLSESSENTEGELFEETYQCFDNALKELLFIDGDNLCSDDSLQLTYGVEDGFLANEQSATAKTPEVFVKSTDEPLVSVLIPAYNRPQYLEIALNSVLDQSYKNIEIIIGDDSTTDDNEKMMQKYLNRFNNIRYIKHGKPLGGMGIKNAQKIYSLSRGQYVNFLMDDDFYHKDKISQMMYYFNKYDDLSLVTSYRQTVDTNGNFIEVSGISKKLFNEVTFLNGKELAKSILLKVENFIGEPTTVLFKKSALGKQFGVFNGIQFGNLIDVAAWIELLSHGDAVYIPETLSYFRIHEGQNQKQPLIISSGVIEWYNMINCAQHNGLLSSKNEYQVALRNWIVKNIYLVGKVCETKDDKIPHDLIYNCFTRAIERLIKPIKAR